MVDGHATGKPTLRAASVRGYLAWIAVFLAGGVAISLLFTTSLDHFEEHERAFVYVQIYLVTLYALSPFIVMAGWKKHGVAFLEAFRFAIGTVVIASCVYYFINVVYPVPVLRFSYVAFGVFMLGLSNPGATLVVEFPSYTIIFGPSYFTFNVMVACTNPVVWVYFIGIALLFPGLPFRERCRRFLRVFAWINLITALRIYIDEMVYIHTNLPWESIHTNEVAGLVGGLVLAFFLVVITLHEFPEVKGMLEKVQRRGHPSSL